MDAGLAALCGSLIGGAVVLIGNYIQASLRNKQALVQRAAELAMKEYGHEIEITRGTQGEVNEVAPLANYIAFHLKVLSELGSRGGCSVARIKELQKFFEVELPEDAARA